MADDGQANPGSFDLVLAVSGAAIDIKNKGLLRFRNTATVIPNLNAYRVPAIATAEQSATARRKLYEIGYKVAQQVRQGQRLHIHLYRTGLEFAQIHRRFKAAIHFIDGLPQTEEDFLPTGEDT